MIRARMILYFDTSGLNRLHQDEYCEPLIAAIRGSATVLISAYNVAEALKTRSQSRRAALVDLMKRLTGNIRMLDRPSGLVRLAATAFATGNTNFVVNADAKLEGLWIALSHPDQITDAIRRNATDWLATTGGDFSRITSDKREQLQDLYQNDPAARPRTAAAALRQYFADRDHLYERFSPRYERVTGCSIDRITFDRLIAEPLYALHIGAYIYGVYQRAVRERGYSNKWHAGGIDLGQAVYLAMCDRFVTDDVAQYRALRLVNRYNTKRTTEVLRYDTFRRRIVALA
jgi:hypothetical protein